MPNDTRVTANVIFQLPYGVREVRLDLAVAEEAMTLVQRFGLPHDPEPNAHRKHADTSQADPEGWQCIGPIF